MKRKKIALNLQEMEVIMIFDYFRKRREASESKIRAEEERVAEMRKRHREQARKIVEQHSSRTSYSSDTSYTPTSYASYDSGSSWSDSGSSSCDSGGGGGCD